MDAEWMAVLDRCTELAQPSIANFVFSIFILLGILVSYLPQHYKVIARRSSEGLSPYFVLLGATSGTCAISNILVLPKSRIDIGCCRVNSAFACTAGLLGIAQIGVQWSCFFFITFLFLIFIPRPSTLRGVDPADRPLDKQWRVAIIIVAICVVHFMITFIVSVVVFSRFPDHLQGWANFLGILGTILASIQYVPQIYMTYKLQEVASLSIPMMCIQTPGAFVWATSLIFRYGAAGWSAWLVYLVTGSLQGCLLVMAIIFETRDRRQRKHHALASAGPDLDDEGSVNVEGETETSPLLHNGHQGLLAAPRRGTHRSLNPLAPERLAPEPSSSSSDEENGNVPNRRKSWAGFRKGSKRPTTWFSARSRTSTSGN